MNNRFFIFLIMFSCFSTIMFPQEKKNLDLFQIMKGDQFVGYLPEDIRWSEDSKTVYFSWNPGQELLRSQYKINIKGLEPVRIPAKEHKDLPAEKGDYSRDFSWKVYSKNGDIFLMNSGSGEIVQVTNTLDQEIDPVFTADEQKVIYRKGNNLYSWARNGGHITQLTHFTSDKPGKEEQLSDREKWLQEQELELFDILAERKKKREQQEEVDNLLKPERPLEINIHGKRLIGLHLSPDEKFAVIRLSRSTQNLNGTEVPDYVTESGYIKNLQARPKVGSPEPEYEMGIYNLEKDTVYYVDPKKIPGIYEKPQFLKDYLPADSTFDAQYKTPRKVIYLEPVFNQKGDRALVVIRSLDNKDRWIMLLNLSDGTLNLIDRQRDEAWISGPGIGIWNYEKGNAGWLGDDVTTWFQSEVSGYSHLYAVNTATGTKRQLTSGPWEVYEAKPSKDGKYFYVTANREGPADRYFYRLSIADTSMIRYHDEPGNYEVKISPNEKMLAIRYSYSNKPWELYLMPNKPGARIQQVTHSTTPDFDQYPWRDPEIIRFRAKDGVLVSARLYRPEASKEGGAAVIFVHGAGYLQNVHHWWSQYFREYMFHNLLADRGYTVLDIDYRGSEGYGRDWRVGIYRHMGGKDLSDQVDGARYLVDNLGIDPERIGIYGGSYGGFITIFAMFKFGDIFKCGAALRSVTDWAHYNHPYTSNILNTPVEDSLAYRRSSPIYYADGLQGELLMLHGVIDTNVQFQDVIRLSQKLIELGKDNWSLAVFPLEDHSFKESNSWTDEYRRILDLFERNLR